MPTVRIIQSVAGLDFSWVPGDEIDMTDEQAAGWADGIRGELVAKEPVIETPEAVVEALEAPEGVDVPERAVVEAPETPEVQPARRGPGRPRKS